MRNYQKSELIFLNDKISVIMGIYNCAETLQQAVESIINQTYANWELIMCDDGSSDNTHEVAKRLSKQDNRIILVKNDSNRGLNITLNRCLSYATGDYIARMDGDDECLATRFEKQIHFLQSQGKYQIVSSSMFFFDDDGVWGRNYVVEKPTKEQVVTGSPICHAPVMMKKECMDKVNGYTVDKRMLRVEDVNLWIKLYAEGYRCYNFQEPLYRMRNDKNAYTRRKYKYRINSTFVRLKGCKQFGLSPVCYIKSFKPMVIGLIPSFVRRKIVKEKKRLQ